MSKQKLIVLGGVAGAALIIVLIVTGVLPGLRRTTKGPPTAGVELAVWGTFDDSSVLEGPLLSAGAGANVTYRRIDEASYETELVNALAAGRGPDIFMFHNTWLPKHVDKIVPAPPDLMSMLEFRDQFFPLVVEQDFAPDGTIYALPLYLDTMALLYNKDLFDVAGIGAPPRTWSEFERLIPRLRDPRTLTGSGEIRRAAAAIGGSTQSVNRATDLLSLFMLQTGTAMTDNEFSAATFANDRGLQAFLYYLKFANAGERDLYTWNDGMSYSLDAMGDGKVAMMFNYSHQLFALKEKNPFLRVGVAPMPQPDGASEPVNYPNYWGFAVSAQSFHPAEAWQVVKNLTTNADIIRQYLEASGRPPALRTLIDERVGSEDWDVFARQAYTARSWPQIDNLAVEDALSNAIRDTLTGRLSAGEALNQAEEYISSLMSRRR